MNRGERRAFVRGHRTAVFGYNRRSDGPAQSIVYYVMDGDYILVSTMGARAKAKAVSFCGCAPIRRSTRRPSTCTRRAT